MNGSELYDMFAEGASMDGLARSGGMSWFVSQIHEMRQDEPDDINMTDLEITEDIVKFTREEM